MFKHYLKQIYLTYWLDSNMFRLDMVVILLKR